MSGCEYCNGRSYGNSYNRTMVMPMLSQPSDEPFTAEKPFAALNISIVGKQLETIITAGFKTTVIMTDINYCPMCGRKLINHINRRDK